MRESDRPVKGPQMFIIIPLLVRPVYRFVKRRFFGGEPVSDLQ